jgi:Zn-dependent M28 family amino/carboxypeptidase
MDMIGSLNSPSPGVLLEGAPLSQPLIERLAEVASTYTALAIETSLHPFASDHVPFIEKGIPAVLTIESSDNANHAIHSGADTIDRLDYDLLTDIVRMNVAFIAGC